MEDLDVRFAQEIERIIHHSWNYLKTRSNILDLVHSSEYEEYFRYLDLDRIYIPQYPQRINIRIYFLNNIVPIVTINDITSLTRVLFDTSKYLEFKRKKILEHVIN